MITLLLSVSLLLWNCQKEEVESVFPTQESITIEEVKEKVKDISFKKFTILPKSPLWDEAKQYVENEKVYLEIPFNKINYKNAAKNNAINHYRLLAYKNNYNEIEVHIVKYFATDFSLYSPNFNTLFFKNTNNFNGFITLLNTDNEPLEVNRYNRGVKSEINYVTNTKEFDKDKHLARAPSEEPCVPVVVSYECTRTVYWLGDETNIISAGPWRCVVTGYSEGSDTDCSNGNEGGSYSTNNEILEEALDKIINNLTGKAKCLNDSLTKSGSNFVKNILSNFQGDSKFDIKIESKDKVYFGTDEVTGATRYTKGNNIVYIDMSIDKISTSSSLASVRSLIHEYIHADMFRKINTTNYDGDLDFKTTYEYFKNSNFKASSQHETMAKLYINSMRDALKNFHKNVLTSDYNKYTNYFGSSPTDTFYEALAWQGLSNHGVKAYTDLSDIRKKEISSEAIKLGKLTKDCPK